MKEYLTLGAAEVTIENVIEKSRFIASAIRVDTAEQAAAFVESKRKKYYNEPQGTAGMPIYECIKNNGLDCVCVVVTRYFGGVKLGAGGLVRAYSGACADVLRSADKVSMRLCRRAEVTVEYSLLKVVRKAMQDVAVEQRVDFSDKVTLHYLVLDKLSNTIADIISQNTLGKCRLVLSDTILSVYGNEKN